MDRTPAVTMAQETTPSTTPSHFPPPVPYSTSHSTQALHHSTLSSHPISTPPQQSLVSTDSVRMFERIDHGDMNSISSTESCDELFSLPSSKRPKLDAGAGMIPESGVWRYKNKPVGIAQPFQKKEFRDNEPVTGDDCFTQKPLDIKTELAGSTKETWNDMSGAKSNSFDAKTNASDANTNASYMPDVSFQKHSATDSSTESNTSASESSEEERPTEDEQMEGLDPTVWGESLQDEGERSGSWEMGDRSRGGTEEEEERRRRDMWEEDKRSRRDLREEEERRRDTWEEDERSRREREGTHSQQTCLKVPEGRKCHLFITHSTHDQEWARSMVMSLSSRWTVKACYQFMPDPSCYNNSDIRDTMMRSCVILVGISHPYLRSSRCSAEWEFAVRLSKEQPKMCVVVGQVDTCNRPEPLKAFLYLDFNMREKREGSRIKLIEVLNERVENMQQASLSQEDFEQDFDCHSQESQSTSDFDSIQVQENTEHMMADFEAMYNEEAALTKEEEEEEEEEGEEEREVGRDGDNIYRTGVIDQRGVSSEEDSVDDDEDTSCEEGNTHVTHSLSDTLCCKFPSVSGDDQSCDQSHDTTEDDDQSTDRMREGEISRVKVRRQGSSDIEEGELSESSDSKGNSQEISESNYDVAKFYDELAQPNVDRRDESPIKLMRNFNNWVKSILIRTYLDRFAPGCTVLDLCCGKGGDLLKWKEGRIEHLVCADISSESIAAAKERYWSPKMTRGRGRNPPYSIEYHVSDCTKDRLIERFSHPLFFHITSCQFSVHYSFESYENAHMMLRNACEGLRPGGYFIGTTIDADELVHRLRKSGPNEEGVWSIGNEIYTVTLDSSLDINNLPLFGARYNFKLHGVVDLPEYLVHFPLLEKMLEPFQMELELRQNFYDYFDEHRHKSYDNSLLFQMGAFDRKDGTMSKAQWDAIGLYLVFAFKKKKPSSSSSSSQSSTQAQP